MELALAMSRYLVFSGVALTLLRVTVEAGGELRKGRPVGQLVVRRFAYVPLAGVLIYYARAMFWPGIPAPTSLDLTVINTLFGVFFVVLSWPRRRRWTDRRGRWR